MTIFDVLALIGGLCLFLFGMNVMEIPLKDVTNTPINIVTTINIDVTTTAFLLLFLVIVFSFRY